jgi:hypothetical protein
VRFKPVDVPSLTPVQDTLKEAIEHNKGVPLGQSSQFTSWTKQKRVAEIFAGRGGMNDTWREDVHLGCVSTDMKMLAMDSQR